MHCSSILSYGVFQAAHIGTIVFHLILSFLLIWYASKTAEERQKLKYINPKTIGYVLLVVSLLSLVPICRPPRDIHILVNPNALRE
jgi:asparagine N-glycosylation enzyme membrane subunit Stt3